MLCILKFYGSREIIYDVAHEFSSQLQLYLNCITSSFLASRKVGLGFNFLVESMYSVNLIIYLYAYKLFKYLFLKK